MKREWVRLTVTNTGSLDGIFLAACRHLLKTQEEQQQQYFKQLALQYKVSCLESLREAISIDPSSLINDSAVAVGILLAYDEVS